MARSHGVVKVGVWAPGSEFRALTKEAQRAYVMLLSQPQINNCGVLAYTPERWARYAADDTVDALEAALLELGMAKFVLRDLDTRELLIRTFIKHDKIDEQPNLKKAAQREFCAIESDWLRRTLSELYPWIGEPPAEGVGEPLSQRAESDEREGGNARTPAAPAPTPTPLGSKDPADSPTQIAHRLFEHWKEVWDHPRSILNPPRRALVARRLKDGFDEATMRAAIDGSKRDDWPDRAKPLNHAFELILRDAKHIEAMAAMNGVTVNGSGEDAPKDGFWLHKHFLAWVESPACDETLDDAAVSDELGVMERKYRVELSEPMRLEFLRDARRLRGPDPDGIAP